MFFADIIGQKSSKKALRQMVKHEKLAHALLISGPEGSGHLGLAFALASYLLCENRTESDSCGSCPDCKRSHQFLHPDIHYAFPVIRKQGKKRDITYSVDFLTEWRAMLNKGMYFSEADWLKALKADDAPADINKAECVAIIKSLSLKSFSGKEKVLILWLPEHLGVNGNRLLKTIEEPPEDSYIFLVSNNNEKILNTILSRCQIVAIPPVLAEDLESYAKENLSVSDQEIKKAVFLAEGNYSIFREILRGEDQHDLDHLFFDWLKMCITENDEALIKWSETYKSKSNEWQKQFFRFGISFFRELLAYKLLGADETKLTDEAKIFVAKLMEVMDLEKLKLLIEKYSESIYAVERNVNEGMLMMAVSLFTGRILRKKKKEEFIEL